MALLEMVETGPLGTSTPLATRPRPLKLGRLFLGLLFAFQLILLFVEWLKWGLAEDRIGFAVAAGAALMVTQLFVVALLNLVASKLPAAQYLWALPNGIRIQAVDFVVGVGFAIGFAFGIYKWIS
jgi:hypothetical protein